MPSARIRASSRSTSARSSPVPRATAITRPLPCRMRPGDRADQAPLAREQAAGVGRRENRGVACSRPQEGAEALAARRDERCADGPDRSTDDRKGVRPAQHADEPAAQVRQATGPVEAAAEDDRHVRREVRRAQHDPRTADAASARSRRARGASPARRTRGAGLRGARRRSARPGRRGGARGSGRARPRSRVRGRPPGPARRPPGAPCRRGSGRRPATPGRAGAGASAALRWRRERDDERCGDDGADHARLQRTSTGVPYVANAYMSGASRAIIRMQPCEAGYAGTEPYAWNAIPPTK